MRPNPTLGLHAEQVHLVPLGTLLYGSVIDLKGLARRAAKILREGIGPPIPVAATDQGFLCLDRGRLLAAIQYRLAAEYPVWDPSAGAERDPRIVYALVPVTVEMSLD